MSILGCYVRARSYQVHPNAQFLMTPVRSTQKVLLFSSKHSLKNTLASLAEFLRFIGYESKDGVNFYVVEDAPKLMLKHVLLPQEATVLEEDPRAEEDVVELSVNRGSANRRLQFRGLLSPADVGDLLLRLGFAIDLANNRFVGVVNKNVIEVKMGVPGVVLPMEEFVPSYYWDYLKSFRNSYSPPRRALVGQVWGRKRV